MLLFIIVNSCNLTDIISPIIALIAVLISIYSIFFSFRFARNSAKPLLSTIRSSGDQGFGLRLKNYGNGPAIITNVEFKLEGSPKPYTSYIIPFGIDKKYWENYYIFTQEKYYLSPNESIFLGFIKPEYVNTINEKIAQEKQKSYSDLKNIFDEIKDKFIITINYADVFEKQQAPYIRTKKDDVIDVEVTDKEFDKTNTAI